MAGRSGVGRAAAALLAAAALGAATAPAAEAAFGIESFDAKVVDQDGQLYEQAGGHPYEGYTRFALTTLPSGAPDGHVRDIRVDVPPGLMSNPQALRACTDAELSGLAGCPPSSQVGVVDATTFAAGLSVPLHVPLYNMTIGPDQVGRFAFDPKQVVPVLGGLLAPVLEAALGELDPVQIVGGVRDTGDYGQFFTISGVAAKPEITAATLTFWGVPGDPAHDPERGQVCVTVAVVPVCALGGQASGEGQIPFLTNPTRCAGALTTTLMVVSHAGERATEATSTPDGPRNCHLVPFEPTIRLDPDVVPRDAPAGVAFNLHVPQTQFKHVLGSSHVEDVAVTLPPGMTINPAAARGLETCADAQLAQGSHDPVTCPAAARIGDVRIVSTLLPDPLVGALYLGRPLLGNRYRLFLAAGGHGVTVRLKGSVLADQATGRLTVVFADNPQVAFTNLTLTLRGGPRAPLAMPLDCGRASAGARLTPYSGTAPAAPAAAVTVAGCAGSPFAPALGARSAGGRSGAFAPFALSIARQDGHGFLSGVTVDLPPGLLGIVAGVERCPDASAATGACPAASRVGTATVAAGAGPEPFGLSGPVYLTGPYGGAPFGLAVAIRAIAGPYDLGTVVVRQGIRVAYDDAHLTVVSDPLPQVVEGVPLRLRSVVVDVDRERFVRNPTACGPRRAVAALRSAAGAAHGASAELSFAGCEALRFAPRLRLALTGRGQLRVGRHPGLRARVTQREGEAGIRTARVALPLSLALDPANARRLCEHEAGLRGQCPRASVVGRVRARTPLLDRPLRGPVYLVQGVRTDARSGRRVRTLPTLLASLRGEVGIDLRAATSVRRGRLVTTFPAVPDAPITRFTLKVAGGREGILVASRRLCRRRQVARAALAGHNGKRRARRVRMRVPCRSRAQRAGAPGRRPLRSAP